MFCFDLKEVLLTPKGFESSLYYKRRLNTYNLSIYDIGTSNGYCYVWDETVASRGASEIASCIYHFIKTMSSKPNSKKKFVFYSDNCFSQNKNRYYTTMLWFAMQKFDLESIHHKYLEKGHSQNENDSIHASVERASRFISVYTPGQWAAVIRSARHNQPYHVKEMGQKDFYDFRTLSSNIKNFDLDSNRNRLFISYVKTLKMHAEQPDMVFYQYDQKIQRGILLTH